MPTVHFTRPQQGYRPFMNPRPLAGLRGLRGGLGQVTPSICLNQAENSVPCSDPNCTYGDCGASGAQVTSGPLCLDDSENRIACNDPRCEYGDCISPVATPSPAGIPATPSPTVMAGVPTGSYLAYTATWQYPGATLNGQDLLAAVLQVLKNSSARTGLQVVGASQQSGIANINLAGTFAVQIQLFVSGPGFSQPNDAGSYVDNAFYQVTKAMPANSSTVVTKFPAGTSTTSVPTSGPIIAPQTSLTSWLEQNALWLGLGIAAIVVLPRVIK